jgi:hypothetical protein
MRPLTVTESDTHAEPLAQCVPRLRALRFLLLQEIQARLPRTSRPNDSGRLGLSVRCKGWPHRGFQESLVAVREPRPASLPMALRP